MKNIINLTEVTADQVINSSANEYNPSEWKSNVLRYTKRDEPQFFQDLEEKETFYVKYKIEEGLVLFNQLSYSHCMHNGGFTRMIIVDGRYCTEKMIEDLKQDPKFSKLTTTSCVAYKRGFGDEGKQRVANIRQGRKWLVENICKFGVAITND